MMLFPIAPETFRTVDEELLLFGGSVLLGIPAGLTFDTARLFRRLIPHRHTLTVIAEDMLFLILTSFLLLCYTSAFAGGKFRICYAVGCLAGFVLYECTLGMIILRCCDLILMPFRWAGHRIVRICGKIRYKFVECSKKSRRVKKNSQNSLQDPPYRVYNNLKKHTGRRSHGRQNKNQI